MDERNVVLLALDALNDREHTAFHLLGNRPDEIERTRPAVDFLALDEDSRDVLAIEHTTVEPFHGSIQLSVEVQRVLGPLTETLDSALPAGSYFQLCVDRQCLGRVRPTQRAAIEAWVTEIAPALQTPPNHFREMEGLSYRLVLYRWPANRRPTGAPKLTINMLVDTDDVAGMAERQVRRLEKTVHDKLGKLNLSRGTHRAAATLLVLENRDPFLTNPWDTAQALQSAVHRIQAQIPDFVFMVDTFADERLVYELRTPSGWAVRLT